MSQLDQAETQALRDAVQAAAPHRREVAARNFRQPRRLSSTHLHRVEQLVHAALPDTCSKIAQLLRGYHKLQLVSLREVNFTGMLDDLEPPFLVHCFQVGGAPAWVMWEAGPASHAADAIVTGELQEDVTDRRLSRSEARVVAEMLDHVTHAVCRSIELEAESGRVAQYVDELVTLRQAGPDADTRRLMLHLAFEGPGGPSDLRLYVPGVSEHHVREVVDEHRLPEHLDSVHFTVSACLGSVDVPLSQLLSLEVGDVIPLGVHEGAELDLYVEENACARAHWGQHDGQLAVRIERIEPGLRELHPPTE